MAAKLSEIIFPKAAKHDIDWIILKRLTFVQKTQGFIM
jgi:hypothetical protein